MLGDLDDAFSVGSHGAEGCHEGAVVAAQDEHVGVRLVQVVVELGQEHVSFSAHRGWTSSSSTSWCQKTREWSHLSTTSRVKP